MQINGLFGRRMLDENSYATPAVVYIGCTILQTSLSIISHFHYINLTIDTSRSASSGQALTTESTLTPSLTKSA